MFTNLNNVLHKSFQGWKFISVYNRKNRQLTSKARVIHSKGIKSHYFMQWIKTAIIVCKAKLNNEKRLKRKLFLVLLGYIELKENKVQHIQFTDDYHIQRI